MVGLPLQTTVVGGKSLLVALLLVQQVAHEVVQVGHQFGIARLVDLAHAALEGLQGLRAPLLLVVGQSLVVVEHHFLGIVQRALVADVGNALPVLAAQVAAQHLRAGTHVLRRNGQQLPDGVVDAVLGHLLQRHVGHLHLGHVRVLRVHAQHLVVQAQYHRAVAAGLLVFLNGLAHHHALALRRGLRAQQNVAHHLAGQRVLVGDAVVVVHRRLCVGVLGLLAQGRGEQFVGLLLLVVLHQPVAHHHAVVHVAGVLVGERLQRLPCRLLVAHHLVDAHLRQRNLLALSLDGLHAVQGVQHAVVVLVLLVELYQYLQHVGALVVLVGQPLVDGRRVVIFLRGQEVLPQPFGIGVVLWVQLSRPLQTYPRERVLVQFALVHRHIEPCLGGIGVDVQTVFQQVVGSVVVLGTLLAHGLQEEVLVAQRVFGRQLLVADGRRLLRGFLLLALLLGLLLGLLLAFLLVLAALFGQEELTALGSQC